MGSLSPILPRRRARGLVEYEKTIAREDDDLERWLGTGRHFGNRINIICVDGRCRTVEDWELKPAYQGLWVP